ncbi:MAG: TetR/AcrR family transcriptional regulator [Propionibacteriales bacterium]|nr:TetR/AcrR family transcriptional regulator [Propionibacteriales bacterium]
MRGPGKDHDAIRQTIVDAAGVLVAAEGVDALTFRRVATAAKVSPGRVQHYFGDRSALVHASFENVQQRVRRRVAEALPGPETTPYDVVTAVLQALVPRNEGELEEQRMMAAFEGLALTDSLLAEDLRVGHSALVDLLNDQFGLLVEQFARPDAPAGTFGAAGTLAPMALALAEGLSGQVLSGRLDADTASGLINTFLAGVRHG